MTPIVPHRSCLRRGISHWIHTLAAALVLAPSVLTAQAVDHDAGPASSVSAPAVPVTPTRAVPPAQSFTIVASEYAFDAPDTVPAGVTKIRLTNTGSEVHHAQMFRLDDGKTMADVHDAMMEGHAGPPPAWMHFVGGPNGIVAGVDAWATMRLAPGRYLLTCFVPSPDGQPHIMKGMVKELIVTGSAAPPAALPATITMRFTDYAFKLSTPITRGTRTIRVRNLAAQPHEVEVFQMQKGKTMDDMMAWLATEMKGGPPPGLPLGGIAGIAKGNEATFTMKFAPGTYALVCFLPDAGDGKPHFVHGMTRMITVR